MFVIDGWHGIVADVVDSDLPTMVRSARQMRRQQPVPVSSRLARKTLQQK